MHNWRFLLLAIVAIFQPIASYSERGLVNGRQQRCDYRTASVLREPGLYFNGIHRFSKPAVDRRLNQRVDIREIRRNEIREDTRLTISSSDRRLVDSLERRDNTPTRAGRFSRTEPRLAREFRDGVVLRQETHEVHLGDNRKDRNQEHRTEQVDIYGTRRTRLNRQLPNSRISENENRINNRRLSALRRDIRGNRDNAPKVQRVQEIRETRERRIVTDQRRDDLSSSSRAERRIARERSERMDTERLESRLQVNRNTNQDGLEQRFRSGQLRTLSASSARVLRARSSDEARISTPATHSLDRDEHRSIRFQQSVDERTQRRDNHRSRVTINENAARATNLRSDRSDERREVGDIRSIKRDQSMESRRERSHAERETRQTNEMKLVDDRVRQNSRWSSRISDREIMVEKRRVTRDIQGMERQSRSVERVAETRRVARSSDRARVSDNRREVRNIAIESRTQDSRRTNEKDIRTFVLDGERTAEVRHQANQNNKDSCSITRELSVECQQTNRDFGTVARARALSNSRFSDNKRDTRNSVKDTRIAEVERSTDNRRATRNVQRESREMERNRLMPRNIRLNFRDVRSIENERAQARQRDSRATASRVERVESSRRDARSAEDRARARSTDRIARQRRDIQENERDVRDIGGNRFAEARERRNLDRDSRARAASFESRQVIRNVEKESRSVEDERNVGHRRATRGIERDVRSIRAERMSESRRDVRKADRERLTENRRERDSENRREIRNIEKEARSIRTEETRREELRIINTARSRESLSMDRRNHRMTERVNIRNQLNRRSQSTQRESRVGFRHTFEKNNKELERREAESTARKQEFLSMITNSKQDENEGSIMNWQYVFYTLQGLYICGVLTQLMNERTAVKKSRAFSWWSSPQHLIKVD